MDYNYNNKGATSYNIMNRYLNFYEEIFIYLMFDNSIIFQTFKVTCF